MRFVLPTRTPVLLCALVLYLHGVQQVDALHVAAAWAFVGFRCLHSAVHCIFIKVMLRCYL